jgi:hypothetical protein
MWVPMIGPTCDVAGSGLKGAMMLDTQSTTVPTPSNAIEPFILHPVEVRQLRLRQDELAEEIASDTSSATREAVVAELVHVREILGRVDRGIASTNRRAGLAA